MGFIETVQKMLAGVTVIVKEIVFLSMSKESVSQNLIKQKYLFDQISNITNWVIEFKPNLTITNTNVVNSDED